MPERPVPPHDHTRFSRGGKLTSLAITGLTTTSQSGGGGGGGVTDHGGLSGLGDDDHTQYLLESENEAIRVAYDDSLSGLDAFQVQDALDELARAIDYSVATVGSLTAGGSPATVVNDSSHNHFPGLVRLDPTRILCVYRRGTAHLTGGEIYGIIGTLDAARTSVTWGTGFLIYTNALDVRCEDAVSIVDNQIVIAARLYDGADNDSPFIIICDDAPTDFTETSTWGSPISIPLTTGTVQNYTQGHVQKLANDWYVLGVGWQGAGTHTVGMARWTASLDDPSAATFETIASGADDHSEICIQPLNDTGSLLALIRSVTDGDIKKATSTDYGDTWSSVTDAFDGYGYPMFRQALSDLILTVYRDAPNGDNAWRVSTNSGTSWGSETILDTTGTRSAYATLLQLTPYKLLCAYAIEYSSDGSTGGGDIFTQLFTDSSTFGATNSVIVQDEGVAAGTATVLNFTGAGGTASVSGGTATINITGGNSLIINDEGAAVGTATVLDFVGAGVTATFSGGTATATISGGTAAGSLIINDEGTTVGTATVLDFVGAGVTATFSGGTATATISGGTAASGVGTAYTRSTGNYTTASTTFADMDATNMAFTFTTGANRVLLGWVGSIHNNNGTALTSLTVSVDGTDVGGLGLVRIQNEGNTGRPSDGSFVYMTDVLSAASHTFKMRWLVGANSTATAIGTAGNAYNQFWAKELT